MSLVNQIYDTSRALSYLSVSWATNQRPSTSKLETKSHDWTGCRAGISLVLLLDPTSVVPEAGRKSKHGRKKNGGYGLNLGEGLSGLGRELVSLSAGMLNVLVLLWARLTQPIIKITVVTRQAGSGVSLLFNKPFDRLRT